MMTAINMPNVAVDYTKFAGGIDQSSPTFSIKPGYLLDGLNYEIGTLFTGYPRIDGYQRFDGRTQPHSAGYWLMPCTITGSVAVGNTVTGVTSSVTGKVLQINAGELVLGRVSGTFNASEVINIGGSAVATTTGATIQSSATTAFLSATYKSLAANDVRADITVVPGSGSILGTVMYTDVLYAWRNNALGTASVMHKSTTGGWAEVTMPYEISFGTGLVLPTEGATIVGGTSGATAIIRRVVTRTGAWGSTAAGTLIVNTVTGTWQNGEPIQISAVTQATSTSVCAQIVLAPSGRYEFEVSNFYGQQDKTRLYGVDGKNPAFEFDGTYYIPLHTGMTTDTPTHLAVHKKHLFLSFKSSAQSSSIGNPYGWSVITGASEIATGENIVGFARQPGDVLAIFNRNMVYQVLGSSSANWAMSVLTPETGAIEHTIQNIGYSFSLDDRGVIKIAAAQNYGDFDHSTVSRMVQPLIDSFRPVCVASSIYRKRNQYRLYGSDGSGIIMGLEGAKVSGFSRFKYPVGVNCVWTGEDSTGVERAFMGSTNGYVYELNRGTSFDGDQIDAFVFMPYNTAKTPRYRKQYRKIVLEMQAVEYSAISFFPEFSYGDTDISSHALLTTESTGAGGHWDISNWDSFYYDQRTSNTPEFSISGTGISVSVIFYSRSAIDAGHTLNGAMLHYTLRRLSR